MRKEVTKAKRIVIKVGTSTLIYPNGNINLAAIDQLAFVLSDLRNQGKEVVLVSSGAVGVGMHKMNQATRPTTIPEQQAIAAIGQAELMNIYNQRFQCLQSANSSDPRYSGCDRFSSKSSQCDQHT